MSSAHMPHVLLSPKSRGCVSPIAKAQDFVNLRRACQEAKRQKIFCKSSDEGQDAETNQSDWKLPVAGSDTDWREFRARLVSSQAAQSDGGSPEIGDEKLWAHPLAAPEQGCLLLAHPLMFGESQTYFHQAVILITSYSEENGTGGIILNKPLEHLIGQLAGAEELMPEFSQNRLFLGGDVGGQADNSNVLQLLHDQKQLAHSKRIVDGVYLGGFQAAKMAVRRDEIDAVKTCRWFCRYAGWAPGQLESECERGVWFTAAASKDMIMHPSCLENGLRHWHTVMQSMGGDYKQVSEALLVEPETREEVWGKKQYIQSVQPETMSADPDNEESP